jgi:ArsR family transcriptional regulator
MQKDNKYLNNIALDSIIDFYKKTGSLDLVANFYKLFGDPTRIRILSALAIEEMNVCDIAKLLEMTKSAISHQLKKLRDANLVKYRRSGKEIFYSLDDDHVKTVLSQGVEHVIEKNGLRG